MNERCDRCNLLVHEWREVAESALCLDCFRVIEKRVTARSKESWIEEMEKETEKEMEKI